MPEPVLRAANLVKRFGGLVATDQLSFEVLPGEIHGLIGPNGAGKTTAIMQICGELAPDEGHVFLDGEAIDRLSAPERVARGIGRTFQITQLLEDFTALDNVALAVQARAGHSFRFLANARRDANLIGPAMACLDRVGLKARAAVQVASLSHGEQKQLELAIALAREPRLLVLDEPMAGLGASESRQMIETLLALKGRVPMLLVEHDMDAVFALADRISVLVYGRCIASGTCDEVRDNPDVRVAYLGEGDA
jgi:branched-chain amino acid transport system ATP-binding protein